MKKRLIIILSLVTMLATAGTAMAAGRAGNGTCDGTGLGIGNGGVPQHLNEQCDGGFIDENGDGVCDNAPAEGGMHHGGRW
ncbi:MAG: hypothetical protein PWP16_1544 [Eubacteriaceae bacterium]|nr:hypothetical protein [Eubacteriaceae bacterium]MDK2936511.1 hypothetical protein [Eubacteriaceae bacterium]MDN5308181.1 hypothetical protein [Eubacteriaceae bacterium]